MNEAPLISKKFKDLQDHICKVLNEKNEEDLFITDEWNRPGGGGGRSRVIENKKHLSKGGVNFSEVFGELPQGSAIHTLSEEKSFFATGVSVVLHAVNPFVPIIHMNVRYFELGNGEFWFGGGIDLSPVYVMEEDASYFHSALKSICDKYNKDWYKEFSIWADNYFYLPHRNETRGIGGIFFDHLKTDRASKEELLQFCLDLGTAFPLIYSEIMNRRKNTSFGKEELEWQQLRRGRYVEFNLVLDKGTRFGLETNGRTESILMSLPETASWKYNHKPAENSKEAHSLSYLVKGYSWV